jgi:hypothetical protein
VSQTGPGEKVSVSREDQRNHLARHEPATPIRDADAARHVYIDSVAAVYIGSTNSYVVSGDEKHRGTEMFLQGLKDSVKPRDALEEMLVNMAAATYARFMRLNKRAAEQDTRDNVAVVNHAADQAANAFRKLMLGLTEYRRPRGMKVFAPHANVGQYQQVNYQDGNAQDGNGSNEQGLSREREPVPPLPVLSGGFGCTASRSTPPSAVDAQRGPAHAPGQSQGVHERAEARPIQRGARRRAKGCAGGPSRAQPRKAS